MNKPIIKKANIVLRYMKFMSTNEPSIVDMEQQKGLFRIMIVMNDEKIRNITAIKKKTSLGTVVYKASYILENLGLLDRKPIKDNPNEKRYQITEKGKRVTEHLLEIDKILKEE